MEEDLINNIDKYNRLKEDFELWNKERFDKCKNQYEKEWFKGINFTLIYSFESPAGEKLASYQRFAGLNALLPVTDYVEVFRIVPGFTSKVHHVKDREEFCVLTFENFTLEFGDLFELFINYTIEIPECKVMLAEYMKAGQRIDMFFEKQKKTK